MKYSLAVFDMDGTILDTLEDLCNSTNFALRACAFPERTLHEVRSFVGNGIRRLIERAVPSDTDRESIDRVFEAFKAHYGAHCADKTKPYNGIPELLCALKKQGYLLAVVSNKADFAVQQLCRDYFEGSFDAAVGERAGVRKKPAPDSVNEVLKILSVSRENAVYIGDSEVDVQTARNCSMDCITVLWGFRDKEVLLENGADNFVYDSTQLLEALI